MQRMLSGMLSAFLLAVPGEGSPAQQPTEELSVASDAPRSQVLTARHVTDSASGERGGVLQQPARLQVEGVLLQDALKIFHETSGIPLLFSPSLLPAVDVDCSCRDESVETALRTLLRDTGLDFEVRGHQVVVVRRAARVPARVELPPELLEPFSGVSDLSIEIEPPLDPAPPAEQSVGTITGRVEDARSGQPLASVQIYVAGLDIGVLTQQNGRYLLQDVPEGTHTLTAERIGYRSATQEVTVGNDETVVQDFALAEEALQLDEVVITGTPGGTQRRAIGNAVGQISAGEISDVAQVNTMQDLLGSREAGLNFLRGTGNIGTGSEMRIRGVASLQLGQQPLIYVDGVRIDNTARAGPNLRDGSQVSTLDDLAPGEIESVEVVKGPAAATLYGTEASAGVIQIITKRGSTGEPQYDFEASLGTNWLSNVDYYIPTNWGRDDQGNVINFDIYERERSQGREWFDYGGLQTYRGSVRGGTDFIRYFLSGEYRDHQGIVPYNWEERTNLRANVTLVPSDEFTADLSLGYVNGLTSFMQQKISYGLWDQMYWSDPEGVDTRLRGFLRARPEKIAQIDATRDVSRMTGSATLNHAPTDWLDHRLTVGMDWMDEYNRVLVPRFPEGLGSEFGQLALGDLQIDNPVRENMTLDYAANVEYSLTPSINLTTSAGAQYYIEKEEVLAGHGQVFPAPAIKTIGSATTKTSDHTLVENKSLGVFVQEQIGWNEKVFVTAAVRGDDNSAFGTDFDAAIYPKFSATWVVSEEGFWEDWGGPVNALRLRSAWGKAGRQPETFAARTLYRGEVGPSGQPAVSTDVRGNPDLGPEVSSELELGFDAGLFQDRVGVEFTYYDQTVEDALISVPVNPTTGFAGSQSANAGQLSNWGWELSADGRVLDRDDFAWDLSGSLSFNDNRVDDIGALSPTNELREGRPYPFFSRTNIVEVEYTTTDGQTDSWPNPDHPEATIAEVTNVLCDGGAGFDGYSQGGDPTPCNSAPAVQIGNGRVLPNYEASLSTTFTVFENLRLYAMAEWRGEHWAYSIDAACRQICFSIGELSVVRPARWADAVAAVDQGFGGGSDTYARFNAGFAKLRELSANYTLPSEWVERFGGSRASVSLAARNPWVIWRATDDIYGSPIDPEGREGTGNVLATQRLHVPALTSLVLKTRISF